MHTLLRISLLLASVTLAACIQRPPAPGTDATPAAPEPLIFAGVLHCPDCDGLRVNLTLDRAGYLYQTREERLGDPAAGTLISTGLWQMVHGTEENADAVVYQLDYDRTEATRNFLLIDDDHIKLLDENGREFWSPYNLILQRVSGTP